MTTTTLVNKTKGTRCSYCSGTISRGANCYRYENGEIRHTHCPVPDGSLTVAAVAAPVAVVTAPARVPAVRAFGALAVDSSFRAWEREYEQEG